MNVMNCQALILDWLLTFLTAFYTLTLKPSFTLRNLYRSQLTGQGYKHMTHATTTVTTTTTAAAGIVPGIELLH